MATSKNIKDADLALQGLDVRLGELLDKALTNTEMLTNSFAKMKDAVPKDVFDHVNGQMDKTKEIAQEITDIESLRGTSAFESAKSQFSIDTKIADIAKERLKLMKMRTEMGEDAYKTAMLNLDNQEEVLNSTKEKWKFDSMVADKQKDMEKNLV